MIYMCLYHLSCLFCFCLRLNCINVMLFYTVSYCRWFPNNIPLLSLFSATKIGFKLDNWVWEFVNSLLIKYQVSKLGKFVNLTSSMHSKLIATTQKILLMNHAPDVFKMRNTSQSSGKHLYLNGKHYQLIRNASRASNQMKA